MSKEQITANILEKTASINILLYIYRNVDRPEGVYLTELIRNSTHSSETIMTSVNTLIVAGVLKDEWIEDGRKKRVFKLTQLGLEVAERLAYVDQALRAQSSQEQKPSQ